jgi:4-amino-4-deoxy-L-arabinose transferase-like glycosyltransferase
MYYQMSPAADPQLRAKATAIADSLGIMEPPVFEGLVALTYRLIGGESLWIARIYAILFWTVGALALYALARKITSIDGALASLAFFLFLPLGVYASRSFQPDPFMVMWIILSAYALYRWSEVQNWKWAILAGFFSGLAILIKVFAVFPITTIAVLLTLDTMPFRRVVTNRQV